MLHTKIIFPSLILSRSYFPDRLTIMRLELEFHGRNANYPNPLTTCLLISGIAAYYLLLRKTSIARTYKQNRMEIICLAGIPTRKLSCTKNTNKLTQQQPREKEEKVTFSFGFIVILFLSIPSQPVSFLFFHIYAALTNCILSPLPDLNDQVNQC